MRHGAEHNPRKACPMSFPRTNGISVGRSRWICWRKLVVPEIPDQGANEQAFAGEALPGDWSGPAGLARPLPRLSSMRARRCLSRIFGTTKARSWSKVWAPLLAITIWMFVAREEWTALIDELLEDGGLDVVVNNARSTGFESGTALHDPEHASLADWRAVHETNLDGVFLGCKYGYSRHARGRLWLDHQYLIAFWTGRYSGGGGLSVVQGGSGAPITPSRSPLLRRTRPGDRCNAFSGGYSHHPCGSRCWGKGQEQ